MITKQGGHPSTATERMKAARAVKRDAIRRELCFASIASRIWPSCLMEPAVPQQHYPFVCVLDTPEGRIVYRVHADDLELFAHLKRRRNDGIKAAVKSWVLLKLATEGW